MTTNPHDSCRPNTSRRYHGLDALRAWAMSMGLILHAAWIMVPEVAGAPKIDASANRVTEYICLAIHTFRMQLFFVLAGLFACLLVQRRGVVAFLKNRFHRIAIPLVLAWTILCPLMMYQFFSAGIASGSILGDVSATAMTVEYIKSVGPNQMMMLHLWFLHHLFIAYLIVVAGRATISWFDPDAKVCEFVSAKFRRWVCSPAAVFLLAIPFAIPMMCMKGPWGIEVSFDTLFPTWQGMGTYLMFFVAGWLIYRNIEQLPRIVCGWRWQLALGLLMTLPYYAYENWSSRNGYATWKYPQLTINDLHFRGGQPDYAALRSRLLNASESSVAGIVFDKLPQSSQRFIRDNQVATQDQINGLMTTLNTTVLPEAELFAALDTPAIRLSHEAKKIHEMNPTDRSVGATAQLNREILQSDFAGIIYSEDIHRPYYWLQRGAYGYCYSLMTWSLILGCIGLFQECFDRESRLSRYFSDASYWFYLAHLPIQFQLLNWFGDQPWHPIVKFSVYVLGTTMVLLPSYHFLVRPTWIGWLLNGRRYRILKGNPARTSFVPEPESGRKTPETSRDAVELIHE